ncbi:MAG TPA: YdcH family protein [Gammaproteobacteria bacterium]|nr:YdcH family protein [Gammaproteobacteria bacterium]
MDSEEIEALKQRLVELRVEHHDLDTMIARLSGDMLVDQIQLRRLKKRKLVIKDLISRLESKLIPDLKA